MSNFEDIENEELLLRSLSVLKTDQIINAGGELKMPRDEFIRITEENNFAEVFLEFTDDEVIFTAKRNK